ncbi:MAG TPA: hypothetical protein VEY31_00815 [Roseococcus sp.]|nr:hypothetical protein [Roseococcus sp.]
MRSSPQFPETNVMASSRALMHARTDAEPERVQVLVAQALATEAGHPLDKSHEAEASRLLTDHAFRLLHNQLAEVRREAVAEHLAGQRRPAGFWTIFGAGLLAALVVGLAGIFLIARPALLAQLTAMLGG